MRKNLYEPLKTLCKRRKSVREFADQPVSRENIAKITQIALTAPYASNRKNWDILVIDDRPTIQSLAYEVTHRTEIISARLREDFVEHFAGYSAYFSSFETAPVVIVPCFRMAPGLSYMLQEPDDQILQWERDTYIKSISCVAMLILLAAESLGLGGCYMTGPLLAEEAIKEQLHISRERAIGAIIPIGYPKEGES